MPTFAAIDIGANSVRLKIGRLQGQRLNIIHEDRQVTRLGEGVFHGGLLSPEAISDTVKVLRRFHRAVQKHGADPVRVVATSALREARNRDAFLEWVYSSTGWRVEIISGVEEARLIHLGLISNLRIKQWPVLMVDLGGGSCELTVSVGGHIRETVSLPLGAVRLTNDFLGHDPPRKKEMERLEGFIDRELGRVRNRILRAKVKGVFATSGTAAALAAVGAQLQKNSRRRSAMVSAAVTTRIARQLARRKQEQRTAFPGIGPRRAEIIIAGAAVYAQLLESCQLGAFRYSPLGLRDGLLAQMVADYGRSPKSQKQIKSERIDSVLASARHYHVDLDHAMQVRDFATHLFDSLRSMHQLPPEYRDWLAAAAMLYEVGAYINRTGRYRHAHYIISHSEMLGFTPSQRRVVAAIARYLGTSRPVASEPAIKVLSVADRHHVVAASVLLRLARALNLGRRGAVKSLAVRIRDAQVVLPLTPKRGSDIELELWALGNERRYFREVFGRGLAAELA